MKRKVAFAALLVGIVLLTSIGRALVGRASRESRSYNGTVCELMGDQRSDQVYVRIEYSAGFAKQRFTSALVPNSELESRGIREGGPVRVFVDHDGFARLE